MLARTLRNLVAFVALAVALSGAPSSSVGTTFGHPSLSPPATNAAAPARRRPRRLDDVCLEQAGPAPAPAPRAVAASPTPAPPAPSCGAGA